MDISVFKNRLAELEASINQAMANINALMGAKNEVNGIIAHFENLAVDGVKVAADVASHDVVGAITDAAQVATDVEHVHSDLCDHA